MIGWLKYLTATFRNYGALLWGSSEINWLWLQDSRFPKTMVWETGKVNKLKLIKRMGYGRAGFPLLRQRVLHAL